MTEVELRLTGYAYGGDALGRDSEGRVVFVPFAIQGETARVKLVRSRRKWARGEIIEIVDPSPQRERPRCIHYAECGGCHYQHMSYQGQLQAKQQILRDQLQRLGGIADPPVERTIPSPSPWNYRNNMRFQIGPSGRPGFYKTGSEREVLEIQECHLPLPAIGEIWPDLELEAMERLHAVGVRANAEGESLIMLHAGGEPDQDLLIETPGSIAWSHPEGWIALAGEPELTFQVADLGFRASAPSFFQIHSDLTEKLVNLVMQGLALRKGELLLDLYAGVGLFSAFAARGGAGVVAVEESPSACADFEFNLDAYPNIALYEARVEQVVPTLDLDAAAAVLDPPREGVDQAVLEALASIRLERVVYVSCDPATLARDAKRLTQLGYEMVRAVPIDLFPQTYHIESVSYWRGSKD